MGRFLLFYRVKDNVQASCRGHVNRSNDMELRSGKLFIKSGPGKPTSQEATGKHPTEQSGFLKTHADTCRRDNAGIYLL